MTVPGWVSLTAAFVAAKGCPTPAELAFGVQHEWISPQDVSAIVRAKDQRGCRLSAAESLLRSTPDVAVDDVLRLCEEMAVADQPQEDRARYWMFVTLAALLEHSEEPETELERITDLFEEFDHPAEMNGIVYWMPAGDGQSTGVKAIVHRWRTLVAQLESHYAERDITGG